MHDTNFFDGVIKLEHFRFWLTERDGPNEHVGGVHSGQRRISGGRAEVRRVLHLAARSAREHNPILRAFGDRLEQRGKPYKVVIVAITRKLLIVARRLCTDPNFVLAT